MSKKMPAGWSSHGVDQEAIGGEDARQRSCQELVPQCSGEHTVTPVQWGAHDYTSAVGSTPLHQPSPSFSSGPAAHTALFSKPFEDRTPASAAAKILCPCAVGCSPSQKRCLSGSAQVEMSLAA